jgi:hypothetical protein
MHGTPVFRGTRVPVQTLFDYLEGGDTLQDFLKDSLRSPALWPFKPSKRLSSACSHAFDAAADRRVRRRRSAVSISRPRLPNCSFRQSGGTQEWALIGRRLDAAEAAGFDVLVTVDQSIPDQQNLARRNIAVLILCGPTNRLRHLASLISLRCFRAAFHRARRCRENQLVAPTDGSRWSSMASLIFRRASFSVSPAGAHPGNSGQAAENAFASPSYSSTTRNFMASV